MKGEKPALRARFEYIF